VVEHETFNLGAVGSSPTGLTTQIKRFPDGAREAPRRVLMHNLDPDSAERPDAVTAQTLAHDPVNGYGDAQKLPLRLWGG
jgi:urocanate hydratase